MSDELAVGQRRWERRPAVYRAAEQFKDSCLAREGSLFTQGAIWTRDSIGDCYLRVVESPDLGKGTFLQKLTQQLADASRSSIQLMAELIFVQLLPIHDTGAQSKRALINGVLALAGDPVSIPPHLDEALETGISGFGAAKVQQFFHVQYLLRFARA